MASSSRAIALAKKGGRLVVEGGVQRVRYARFPGKSSAYLDTDDVEVARKIAGRVRGRDGGLPGLKALGLEVGGKAQVSMNLTDLQKTSLPVALEAVRQEAAEHGASVESTELVGLMPLDALLQAARYYLALPELEQEQVLEAGIWSKFGN